MITLSAFFPFCVAVLKCAMTPEICVEMCYDDSCEAVITFLAPVSYILKTFIESVYFLARPSLCKFKSFRINNSTQAEFAFSTSQLIMPSFLILPPEIRLEIYRLLLHDTAKLELEFRPDVEHKARIFPVKDPARAISLHTAILATCRQVHDEATVVLYQENSFVVRKWYLLSPWEIAEDAAFPSHRFAAIKDLTLWICEYHVIENAIPPSFIAGFLRWLAMMNCSLDVFLVQLQFFSRPEFEDYVLESIGPRISQVDGPPEESSKYDTFEASYCKYGVDSSIAGAVADLSVSKKINIELLDQFDHAAASLKSLVRFVASAKGWNCTKNQRQYYVDQDDEFFLCGWSVHPTEDAHFGFRPA